MAEEKFVSEESQIINGWFELSQECVKDELTDQERARFERALFAEEQARKTNFVLGGKINLNF